VIKTNGSNEGTLFTDPDVQTPEQFRHWIKGKFPDAPNTFVDQVLTYYPDPPDPPRYEEESERLDQLVSGSPPRSYSI
jgi:hypothetical protein